VALHAALRSREGTWRHLTGPTFFSRSAQFQGIGRESIALKKNVVIIGAGFGGLAAATTLADAPCNVTLIDRRNYHLFQPLLYQVATAALSPANIATPIRSILKRQKNATVLMGKVDGIDHASRRVHFEGRSVPYDYLIIATGARHAYFGKDHWEGVAPGLKKIDDATDIRRRILMAFEKAETSSDEAERRALLTFVVVGGGPTGVEMAGAIAELARWALAEDFRNIDPTLAQVLLIEGGPRLLAAFPEDLSHIAQRSLESMGVDVRTGSPVAECDEDGVVWKGERIPSRTVIWAAGVAASPAARWLGVEKDRAGRVIVGPNLTVPGHDDIFVVGDTAAMTNSDGKPVPGIAPAAKQSGQYAARVIAARLLGRKEPSSFHYRHLGSLATIGRKYAVADFGWIKMSGFPAWLLWGLAHIYFLIDFRSRIVVALDWFWAYLTFQRGARLITGTGDDGK
jgi:NADH dehydrogenase FAD-containing subunit